MKNQMKSLLTFVFMIAITMNAQAQLSNYSKMYLQKHNSKQIASKDKKLKNLRLAPTKKSDAGIETVECFVSLNNVSTEEIEQLGGVVNSQVKNMAVVTMPIDKVKDLAEAQNVKKVDIARRVRLLTDEARTKTQAEDVQTLSAAAQAAGLTQKYDGTGVVLGIIDDGIEYNHRAFKTSAGATRVKAVYMPNATTANGGTKKTINGQTLSGYQYTTATQIANLTCDDEEESHGTHTAGCAGGSRVTTTGLTNNVTYSGMAPGVDLILCGCGQDLTDTAISNAALYIANYAKEQNKPCVISISLGSNLGPHDGTSSLCQYYDAIAEQYGAVICLAAGNEADYNFCLEKTLSSDTDYLATIVGLHPDLADYDDYIGAIGDIDVWNSTNDQLQVQFVVLRSNGTAVWTSSKMTSGSVSTTKLAQYFNDEYLSYFDLEQGITIQSGVDATNNRYELYINVALGYPKTTGYKLGMIIYGKSGNRICAWNDPYSGTFATASSSAYTFTAGNANNSICDDVTGSSTISVGAWASRQSIPYNYGTDFGNMDNDSFAFNDIAYFSSFGKSFNGTKHPYVAAPGHSVVSSINRYNTEAWQESQGASEAAYRLSIGSGNYDYWMYMSGTSMATPVAAGICALYLQANPQLTVDDVKVVINESADTDSYTNGSHSNRFGAGKINALKGIKYILQTTGINDLTLDEQPTDERIYNLQGQQLQQLQRGINIVNGKKIFVK